MNKDVARVINAVLCSFGVEFEKYPTSSFERQYIYHISVPESSEINNSNGEEMCGETLAKAVNKTLSDMSSKECKVKFRVRDEHWTKELRNETYNYYMSL